MDTTERRRVMKRLGLEFETLKNDDRSAGTSYQMTAGGRAVALIEPEMGCTNENSSSRTRTYCVTSYEAEVWGLPPKTDTIAKEQFPVFGSRYNRLTGDHAAGQPSDVRVALEEAKTFAVEKFAAARDAESPVARQSSRNGTISRYAVFTPKNRIDSIYDTRAAATHQADRMTRKTGQRHRVVRANPD